MCGPPDRVRESALHQAQRIRDELEALLPQGSFVRNKSIAVLLPCYNEEATIAAVVESFRRVLPGATIYVYDNNSTDRTAEAAAAGGAVVRRERYQGKGNVVRRMFADIEADVYVLADGDLTYDASAAGRLVDALVSENVDMVVGVRVGTGQAFRRGHRFGNQLFNRVVAHLFGDGFTDILSGYRVVSRRFAKSFPAASSAVGPSTSAPASSTGGSAAKPSCPPRASAITSMVSVAPCESSTCSWAGSKPPSSDSTKSAPGSASKPK